MLTLSESPEVFCPPLASYKISYFPFQPECIYSPNILLHAEQSPRFSIIIFYYFCLAMIICAQKLPVIIQRDCKAHIASGFYCSDRIRYLIPIPLFHNNMTKLFFSGSFCLHPIRPVTIRRRNTQNTVFNFLLPIVQSPPSVYLINTQRPSGRLKAQL